MSASARSSARSSLGPSASARGPPILQPLQRTSTSEADRLETSDGAAMIASAASTSAVLPYLAIAPPPASAPMSRSGRVARRGHTGRSGSSRPAAATQAAANNLKHIYSVYNVTAAPATPHAVATDAAKKSSRSRIRVMVDTSDPLEASTSLAFYPFAPIPLSPHSLHASPTGTNTFIIPPGAAEYEIAVWRQQQEERARDADATHEDSHDVISQQADAPPHALTPQPPSPSSKPHAAPRRRVLAFGGPEARSFDVDEKVNHFPAPTRPRTESPPPADDSDETVVVFDRATVAHQSPSIRADQPGSSSVYSPAPPPSHSRELVQLHSGGGVELAVGTHGPAADLPSVAPPGVPGAESQPPSLPSSPATGTAAAASSWERGLFAYLSNPEHRRRLLRLDLHARRHADEDDADIDNLPDVSADELVRVRRSDMQLFSAAGAQALLHVRALASDGRTFGSLEELAQAACHAHAEWTRRREAAEESALGPSQGHTTDAQVTRVLEYLRQPHAATLFGGAAHVVATKRDLLLLLRQARADEVLSASSEAEQDDSLRPSVDVANSDAIGDAATTRLLATLDRFVAQGRGFASLAHLEHAVRAAAREDALRRTARRDLRDHLNSHRCPTLRAATNSAAGANEVGIDARRFIVTIEMVDVLCGSPDAPPQLAAPPPEPPAHVRPVHIGVPEELALCLVRQLDYDADSRDAGVVSAAAPRIDSFADLLVAIRGEKRRLAEAMGRHVRRAAPPKEASANTTVTDADDASPSPTTSPPTLVALGELPSSTLYDEDLLRLMREAECGRDLARHLVDLDAASATNGAAPTDATSTPSNTFATVTDLISEIRARHAALLSRRRGVRAYLSSSRCALFAGRLGPMTVSARDIDRLVDAVRTHDSTSDAPDAVRLLTALDAAGRVFSTVEQLATALCQTAALVAERRRAAAHALRAFLAAGGEGSCLLPSDAILTPPLLDRLVGACGGTAAAALSLLRGLVSSGVRALPPAELVRRLRQAHVEAADTKRRTWSHLHSASSRLLRPLAASRRAAVEAARARAEERRKDTSATTTATSVPVPDQSLASAADRVLEDGSVTGVDPLPTSTSTSSPRVPAFSSALPSPLLSAAEVDALVSSSGCRSSTLPTIWSLEARARAFTSPVTLAAALRDEHARRTREARQARALLARELSRDAGSLFRAATPIARVDLDRLLRSSGRDVRLALGHVRLLARVAHDERRPYDTVSDLVRGVRETHIAAIATREEVRTFLTSPECRLWKRTVEEEDDTDPVQSAAARTSAVHIVSREDATRLYLEGGAGPETMVHLRRMQLAAREGLDRSFSVGGISTTFQPFASLPSLIAGVRRAHATLLRPRTRLLRFFNAPAGAPVATRANDLDEGDWFDHDEEEDEKDGAAHPPLVDADAVYSVHDLVETHGRDLAPVRLAQLEHVRAESRVSFEDLVREAVGMAREAVAASQASGHAATKPRPFAGIPDLLRALAARIAEADQHKRAQQRAIAMPVLAYLRENFAPPPAPAPASDEEHVSDKQSVVPTEPPFDESFATELLVASGAGNETLAMLAEVVAFAAESPDEDPSAASTLPHTRTAIIAAVRAQHQRVTGLRARLTRLLSSPTCGLFASASRSRVPVSWSAADVDLLLKESRSPLRSQLALALTPTTFNDLAPTHVSALVARGVDLGSWRALVERVREEDDAFCRARAWSMRRVAAALQATATVLFGARAAAALAPTTTHARRMLVAAGDDADIACFLLERHFAREAAETEADADATTVRPPFANFSDLAAAVTTTTARALQHQRECLAFLSAEGVGLLASSRPSSGKATGAASTPASSPPSSSVHLSLASMRKLFIEGDGGFETLARLRELDSARRVFVDIYDLACGVRATVAEAHQAEHALYTFMRGSKNDSGETCHFFDLAPTPVRVTRADCARLMRQSGAGVRTLHYVRRLNGSSGGSSDVSSILALDSTCGSWSLPPVDSTTPTIGRSFDDLVSLVSAVRELSALEAAAESEARAITREGRARLLAALQSEDLLESPMLTEKDTEEIDRLICAGSGREVGTAADSAPLSGRAASLKSSQLVSRVARGGHRFPSSAELARALQHAYESDARHAGRVREWMRSEACRLFARVAATNGSSVTAATADGAADRSRTLAHSLLLSEVDTGLLEAGGYFEAGRSPADAIADLADLQADMVRTAATNETAAPAPPSLTPTPTHPPVVAHFRSLASVARALRIAHAERIAAAAWSERAVGEFVTSPSHRLLAPGSSVTRRAARRLVSSSPRGRPLVHLESLVRSGACFASVDLLVQAVETLATERDTRAVQLVELLRASAPNRLFARAPPPDLDDQLVDTDLVERLRESSGADDDATEAIDDLLRTAPNGRLNFASFAALVKAVSNEHAKRLASLSQDRARLLAWLSGPSCQLFSTAPQAVHFVDHELEAFFAPPPPPGARGDEEDEAHTTSRPSSVRPPPGSAALSILQSLDAAGERFDSLRACVRAVHRRHAEDAAARQEVLELLQTSRLLSSDRGLVDQRDVDRICSTTAPLRAVQHLRRLVLTGRVLPSVDEVVDAVGALERRTVASGTDELGTLCAYLQAEAARAPGGMQIDAGTTAARLMRVAHATPGMVCAYLLCLDARGEGVIPTRARAAGSISSTLESRVIAVARDAQRQKRALLALLASHECRLFAHALDGVAVTPSFARLDGLFVRTASSGDGLAVLAAVRQIMRDDRQRFDTFDALVDTVCEEVARERTRRETLAAWLNTPECTLFADPRPVIHSSEAAMLLPEFESKESFSQRSTSDAELDSLWLLQSLGGSSCDALLQRPFASINDLAAAFRPVQRRVRRVFADVRAMLADPRCRLISSPPTGFGSKAVHDLWHAVREVKPSSSQDSVVALDDLRAHLWAIDAAGRRFNDLSSLLACVRAAAEAELDATTTTDKEDSRVYVFGDALREAIRSDPLRSFGTPSSGATDRHVATAPAAADTVAASSAASSPSFAKCRDAVFAFLWSPSCRLMSTGGGLVTGGTVDALFARHAERPQLVLDRLNEMATDGFVARNTDELVREADRRADEFARRVVEDARVANGATEKDSAADSDRTVSDPTPAELEAAAQLSALEKEALAWLSSDQCGLLPVDVAASLTVDDVSRIFALGCGGLDTLRLMREMRARGDAFEHIEAQLVPTIQSAACDAREQRQELLELLNSASCILLPTGSAPPRVTDADVATLVRNGGAGAETLRLLRVLEADHVAAFAEPTTSSASDDAEGASLLPHAFQDVAELARGVARLQREEQTEPIRAAGDADEARARMELWTQLRTTAAAGGGLFTSMDPLPVLARDVAAVLIACACGAVDAGALVRSSLSSGGPFSSWSALLSFLSDARRVAAAARTRSTLHAILSEPGMRLLRPDALDDIDDDALDALAACVHDSTGVDSLPARARRLLARVQARRDANGLPPCNSPADLLQACTRAADTDMQTLK